jgi:predicted nucleotidyltransferase
MIEKLLNSIKEAVSFLEINAHFFGSVATQTYDEYSDVDLIVNTLQINKKKVIYRLFIH